VTDRVDVDGDGRDDRVFWGYDGGDLVLRVCTASGRRSQVEGHGMGEQYSAIDIEPDGRAELLPGGTTVTASIENVVVFQDGRLHAVVGPDGERLTLVAGWTW